MRRTPANYGDGRSPHGERGLKYLRSHLAHGDLSRSPHGERGLKYIGKLHGLLVARRSPQGECGLKCRRDGRPAHRVQVAPRKGSVD